MPEQLLMNNHQVGERKPTNVWATYFCAGFVLILFGFVGYCFFNGSVYRIINGYDDCGNICGMTNSKVDIKNCGPNDKQNDKFLLVNVTQNVKNPNITDVHGSCVKRCEDFPGYKPVLNRCYLFKSNGTDDFQTDNQAGLLQIITQDLTVSWLGILMSCVVAVIFSYIILVLFRYAIKYVIWTIYIGIVVLITVLAILALVAFFAAKSSNSEKDREGAMMFLIVAGVLGIVAVVLALLLFYFRKRIHLVIQLFKEASKALADVPLIVAEPILTFIALIIGFVLFIYFAIVIESSGTLTVMKDERGNFDKAEYVKDGGMFTAHIVNLIAFVWFTNFILGCQHFIIASTVSDWFFARSKDKLDSPIQRGFGNLLRFHIGSVCLGSIFITVVEIINAIINSILSSVKESTNPAAQFAAACCSAIMDTLEELLKYLVRNAYIIVAKDGTPLMASGKRAFHLLSQNLLDVIALNKIGDFVLFLARIFVVLIAGFIGYELIKRNPAVQLAAIPIALACVIAFLIIHCFMTVYEMTLDTIFICFCEDCEENDGMTRPYFMSTGLMEVMQELKQQAGGEFNFGGKNTDGGNQPMMPHAYPQLPQYP